MNLIDLLFSIFVVLAVVRGWRRGLLGLMFELGGGFLGLFIGVALGSRIAGLFTQDAGVGGALVALIVVFVMLSLGQTAGYLVGHRAGAYAHDLRLGGLNSALGSLGGIVLTVVSFWLIGSIVVQSSFAALSQSLARSTVLQTLDDTLPPPPNVLAYFSQYLRTSGFPQVFEGLPRPIGEPVDLPRARTARRAVRAAEASTVRITVPACGGIQLGSGWMADERYAVTNAHVVAGGSEVTVETRAGDQVPAAVVLFDQNIDLAVLYLGSDVSAPPLSFTTRDLDSGAPGATLGYPGELGGRFDADPAAVQDRFTARGRDIYGQASVERDVYELRAEVTQGESGGPFVLPNGSVAGVVFAASTTNPGVGYALTGSQVADDVSRAVGRTNPVSTQSCTR